MELVRLQVAKLQHIPKDLFLLLLISALFSLGIFMSNTFVNVFLWRHTNDLIIIGIYNLFIYLFQPITFVLAGISAKKVDRSLVLQIGIICLALFFIIVLLLNKQVAIYYIPLGSLLGIGYGFYWLAFNLLTFEITEPETRDFFNGMFGSLESLAKMAGPFIAGLIISRLPISIGYMTVFALSFLLFILAIIVSFFLQRRPLSGAFAMRQALQVSVQNNDWKNVLKAKFFQGIRDGLFLFLIPIIVFLLTKNEFMIGMFTLLLSSLSLFIFLLVTRFLRRHDRKKAVFFGCILISGSVYIFFIDISFYSMLVYAIVIGISYPIMDVPTSSIMYDVLGKNKFARQLRIEYVVVLEMAEYIGRLLSTVAFILLVYYKDNLTSIFLLLLLISHAYIGIFIFLNRIPNPIK